MSWIDHMMHTPMNQLAWWEFGLIVLVLLGGLALLFGVSWLRSGKKQKP